MRIKHLPLLTAVIIQNALKCCVLLLLIGILWTCENVVKFDVKNEYFIIYVTEVPRKGSFIYTYQCGMRRKSPIAYHSTQCKV